MLHQTAGFALGQQSNSTTQATTLIRGRMGTSNVSPRYEDQDLTAEHTGIHERPTNLQSTPIRSGYIADWNANFRLYPDLIGYALLGVGFDVVSTDTWTLTITATGGTFTLTYNGQTTSSLNYDDSSATIETALEALSNVTAGDVTVTGDGPHSHAWITDVDTFTVDTGSLTGGSATLTQIGYYSHVFTLADADALNWLSVFHSLGEGGSRYGKALLGARCSQLQLTADNTGIQTSVTGLALDEEDQDGGETITAETDAVLSQANGTAFTFTSSDLTIGTLGVPRTHTITIDQPLDESEQDLHSFLRGSLSPTGTSVSGTIGGLVFGENIYKEFTYGGSGGTAPVIAIPEVTSMTWSFQSPGNITGSTPYSLTFSIALAQFMMQPFDVTGGGQILYEAQYTMIDNAASAPITITLVNTTDWYGA